MILNTNAHKLNSSMFCNLPSVGCNVSRMSRYSKGPITKMHFYIVNKVEVSNSEKLRLASLL